MDCPVCSEALIVVEREGIELDWCLGCRGLWFDEGELELLAEKSGRRLDPGDVGSAAGDAPPLPQRRRCPRCRRRMEPVLVGAPDRVTVDRCAAHGVWLDRGELGRILGQLARITDEDEKIILDFLGETFRSQLTSPAATREEEDERRSKDGA